MHELVGDVLQQFGVKRPTPQLAILGARRQLSGCGALDRGKVFRIAVPKAVEVDAVM